MKKPTRKRNRVSLPRFNLNQSNIIQLVYRYKKDTTGKAVPFKHSTGIKIDPAIWNKSTQRVKDTVKISADKRDKINEELELLRKTISDIVKENPTIDKDALRQKLLLKIDPSHESNKDNFLVHLKNFKDRSKRDNRTIQKYNTAITHLESFIEDSEYDIVKFEDYNRIFVDKFAQWAYDNTEINSPNTIDKYVQVLNQATIDAIENGLYDNPRFKKVNIGRVFTTKVFLYLDEVMKLHNKTFKKKNYNLVKDGWLVSAFTGLRWSDYSKLTSDNIIEEQGRMLIDKSTFKTRQTRRKNKAPAGSTNKVFIPVYKPLQEILERYDYNLPDMLYSSQKMNENIKNVVAAAGINRKEEVIYYEDGKEKVLDKDYIYKYVTNHSGRYTFIDFMVNEFDYSYEQVVKITGQSYDTIAAYDRRDKKDNAVKIGKEVDRILIDKYYS